MLTASQGHVQFAVVEVWGGSFLPATAGEHSGSSRLGGRQVVAGEGERTVVGISEAGGLRGFERAQQLGGRGRSVLSCPVLSCPVLSCPVLSCPVLSCPVLSCPVLSCPVLSCPDLLFLSFL